MRRRGESGLAAAVARTAIFLMALGAAWLLGLLRFVADIPVGMPETAAPVTEERRTDAVAVLTGGHGRLQAGFSLLERGAAKKLFISGVYDGVAVRELLDLSVSAPKNLACCVALGYAAADTVGNAAETADWMEEEDFHSLILVTSNYHMARAMEEFAMAMPDVRITPYPVASPNVPIDDWWRRRGTALLLMSEYSKYLVAAGRRTLAQLIEE